jgi:hypothetical protein
MNSICEKNRNKNQLISLFILFILIGLFPPAKGDNLISDTTIIVNNHISDTISICEGQLVKLVNSSKNREAFNWKWDLGDGTISVLADTVNHYYLANTSGENYHVKLIQVDGTQPQINFDIKINSFKDHSIFTYDSIFCIGQKGILKVDNTQSNYSLGNSPNYTIVKDFGDESFAIIDFIKTGESNLLVKASNGTCSSLIELPFLTATSEWYPFEMGKIVQKPVEANVLIYLNPKDQNKDNGDLEYSWGTYDNKNTFVEDSEYNTMNKNYYKTQIDTTKFRYFVKVKCNTCNSCESIYFFPEY